jgi:hypothetical protein
VKNQLLHPALMGASNGPKKTTPTKRVSFAGNNLLTPKAAKPKPSLLPSPWLQSSIPTATPVAQNDALAPQHGVFSNAGRFTPRRDPPPIPTPLSPIARTGGHRRQASIATPDQARAVIRNQHVTPETPFSHNGVLIEESPEARLSSRAQAAIAAAADTPTRSTRTTQAGTRAVNRAQDSDGYIDIDRVPSPIEMIDLSEVDPQYYARQQARAPFMPRSPLGKRSRTPPRN